MVVKLMFEPEVEPIFLADSYGYRPRKSALDAVGIADPAVRERLLALYWKLSAYPEVPGMLSALKTAGYATGILSNGSPEMLRAAVGSAGVGECLDTILSVEEVGIFKPHALVYDMVGAHFGTRPDEVLFVSSNGWDAAGAAGYGFRTVWVNRAGEPVDRLPGRPDRILETLDSVPDLASSL